MNPIVHIKLKSNEGIMLSIIGGLTFVVLTIISLFTTRNQEAALYVAIGMFVFLEIGAFGSHRMSNMDIMLTNDKLVFKSLLKHREIDVSKIKSIGVKESDSPIRTKCVVRVIKERPLIFRTYNIPDEELDTLLNELQERIIV